MLDEEIQKFVKKEIQKLQMQINEEIRKIRDFSESYIMILLDLALMSDPLQRLTRVLSVVSNAFPQPILEIYVRRSVARARKSKIEFEDFADCLVKGLGKKVNELRIIDEITRVYGFRAGERWQKIIEGSEEVSDCTCKTSL